MSQKSGQIADSGSAIIARAAAEHPALGLALKVAQERFGHLPGVLGFGIGRKYSEKINSTLRPNRRTGGLGVTAFVRRKLPAAKLGSRQVIPTYIEVRVPDERTATRVSVDVVETRKVEAQDFEREGPPWPTIGAACMGRRFTCGLFPAEAHQTVFSEREANLATISAVIRVLSGGQLCAVSAGHAFSVSFQGKTNLRLCSRNFEKPDFDRAVGWQDRSWNKVPSEDFFPDSLQRLEGGIEDLLAFALPEGTPVEGQNILNFRGGLATIQDRLEAVRFDGTSGFIVVERQDGFRRLSVDLLAGVENLSLHICGQNRPSITYSFTWPLVVVGGQTEKGDSGAPVFIVAADDPTEMRLLGFHVAGSTPSRGLRNGQSWAMSAHDFLGAYFGRIGRDYEFV